ncbi:hypothetical protein OROGR_013967 [Orobanche gracilis]
MAGGFCRALRQFTLSKGKSSGRNSSGRITIFHRGGGAKRLQRSIDLKRSASSMGVVERIEYDPNRSSRIALVRWKVTGADINRREPPTAIEEESKPPPKRTIEPNPTTLLGPFAFSSLPRNADDEKKLACFSPRVKANYAVVGHPTRMPSSKNHLTGKSEGSKITQSKITCADDVLFSAFSSPKAKGKNASNSFIGTSGFPRIAGAGAKPPFFVFQEREKKLGGEETFSLDEIQKWKIDSSLWDHRIKRKAAVSWHSFSRQERLGLVGASDHKEFKPKTGTSSRANRAPVSYIIASNQLEVGKMVMNCGRSKPSTST